MLLLEMGSRSVAERVEVSTLPDLVGRLREARERRGWSQAAVAGRLMVVHTTVSNWERGTVPPPAGLLIAWCRLLGLPLWAIPEDKEGGS